MTWYLYMCPDCAKRSFSSKPDEMPCECGGTKGLLTEDEADKTVLLDRLLAQAQKKHDDGLKAIQKDLKRRQDNLIRVFNKEPA